MIGIVGGTQLGYVPAGLGGGGGPTGPGVAAYFGGSGGSGGPSNPADASVDRFSYPTETASGTTPMSVRRTRHAAWSHPGVAGYFAGGYSDSFLPLNSVDKYQFPVDTRTTLGATVYSTTLGQPELAGMSDPQVAGYACGGANDPTNAFSKFAYPTDTRTVGIMATSARRLGAMANPAVAGYAGGGEGVGTRVATVAKIAFPTDSGSNVASIPFGTEYISGFANPGVAGYFAGGIQFSGSNLAVYRYAFPTDTPSTLAATLSAGRFTPGCASNSGVAGYVAGGQPGSNADKFAFPAETRSVVASALTKPRAYLAGMSDG